MAYLAISQVRGYKEHFVTDCSQDHPLAPETTSKHSIPYHELAALILFLAFN